MLKMVFISIIVLSLGTISVPAQSPPLRAAFDNHYPPFSFLDETRRPSGFDVEIFSALAEELGTPVDIKTGVWNDVRNWFRRDELDVIVMLVTEDRKAFADFAIPHAHITYAVFTRSDSPPIQEEGDLRGKRIAVQKGDIAEEFLTARGFRPDVFDNQAEAARQVSAGNYDCAVIGKLMGLNAVKEAELGNLRVYDGIFPELTRKYAFSVKKGNSELLASINEALMILKTNGTIDEIYDRWFVREQEFFGGTRVLKIAAAVAGVSLLLLVMLLIWSALLKKEVGRKTSELKESWELFETIFRDNPLVIVLTTLKDGMYIDVNRMYEKVMGFSREESVGKTSIELGIFPGQDERNRFIQSIREAGGRTENLEVVFQEKKGKKIIGMVSSQKIRWKGEDCLISVVLDVTEKKILEESLKEREKNLQKTLQEKELLLKEIHHRVKNNLQTVSSILNLQSRYVEDRKTSEIFQASRNRIRAMALVHTQLYQSESLSDIELGNYLENLSSLVVSTYDISGGPVSLRKSLDPVIVDVDTAVSVGLLTNEFLSNALKHAFPPGERGEIFLSLTQKGETLELLVRDTGKGLPEDFDIQRSHSLGLKLIEALVLQLKGSLEIRSGNGTEFLVTVAHETAG